jgi:hypothetical protein
MTSVYCIGIWELIHMAVTDSLQYFNPFKSRAVLRRRKNSGFHPEIWLYSGILVILNNYKNATVQPNFRMKSGIFPSPQYYPQKYCYSQILLQTRLKI